MTRRRAFLPRLDSAPRGLRFGLVGLGGVALQVTMLVLLADWCGVGLTTATTLAVAAAIVHNFAWHRHWTWSDRSGGGALLPTLVRFTAANGIVSLVGNNILVSLLVEAVHLQTAVASLVAIAACGLVNYLLADTVVFLPARATKR